MAKIWIENGVDVNAAWGAHIAYSYDNVSWHTLNKESLGVSYHVRKGSTSTLVNSSPVYNVVLTSINTDGSNKYLKFNISDVQNQAGWTNNVTGQNQAVSDITGWLTDSSSGLATELTLSTISSDITDIRNYNDQSYGIDNDPLAQAPNIGAVMSGGKAVEKAAYSPAYTDDDAVVAAYDGQTGRLLTNSTLDAGEAHIGAVGGNTAKVAFAPVTSVGAYAANDNVGGVITLTGALRVFEGTATIQDVSLWVLNNAAPNLYIDFWNDNTLSGTFTNDAAQVIAGNELEWLGMVEIAVADWKQTGVISRCSIKNVNLGVKGSGSANIFMTIQDKTGVTYGSAGGVTGYITMLQD